MNDDLYLYFKGALSDFCIKSDINTGNESISQDMKNKDNKLDSSTNNSFQRNNENTPFKLFESDPELKECWSKLIQSCNEQGNYYYSISFFI